MVDPISSIISGDAEAQRRKREREASFSQIIKQSAVDQVKGVTLDAPPPEEAARATRLARENRVPVPLARADPDGVEMDAKNNILLRELDRAPSIVQFFTDPFRAAIAEGDISEMAKLAQKLKDAAPPPRKRSTAETFLTTTFLNAVQANPLTRGIATAIGVREAIRERGRSGETARDAAQEDSTADRFGSLLERGTASAIGGAERLAGTVLPGAAGDFFQRRASQFERAAAAPVAGEQQFDQIGGIGDLGMFVLEQGVASLPEMSLYLTPGGWISGAAVQTGRIAQQRAENDGKVDASIGDAAIAAPFGIASAALEKLGIESIFVGSGVSAARRIAGAAAGEGVTEFIQGDIEYIGSTAFTDKPFDMEEMAKNAIAGMVAGSGFGGGVRTGIEVTDALLGRSKENTKIASEMARAAVNADTLDAIMEGALKHNMRTRDPETFREFVAEQAVNSGIENVFVPIEAIETYQQSGDLPEAEQAFFERYADQIEEARITGGDVVIPIADAAAYLAGTPAWATLRQDARTDAGGLSPRQVTEQAQQFNAEIEKRGEEIVAAAQAATEADTPAVAVMDEVKQQLLDIGFTEDAATKQAALYAANREAMGARFGVDAAEWHRRNPVEFRRRLDGGDTLGGRVLEQPTADQTQTPEFKNWFGDSKVVDETGAPLVVYRGTNFGGSDPAFSGRNGQELGEGLYFTNSPEYAAKFGNALQPVFLNAENVLESQDAPREGGAYMYGERLARWARARGYDAIRDSKGNGTWQIVIFDPTKIKSAVGNRGSFDPNSANILEQASPYAQPLTALPQTSPGPYVPARIAADAYAREAQIVYIPPTTYAKVDRERAARIAQAYEDMPHAPDDPEVRAAYDAMVTETLAQWEAIKATGLHVEFAPDQDPYDGNPWGAVRDVRDSNHIYVFSTDAGYGQAGVSAKEEAENPMLAWVPGENFGGKPVRVNDIFRVVHDYFGHIKEGFGFRAAGEENAWRAHSAMYSPLARRAMTTETRGQNSWLNFGPHGETNRTAQIDDTIFAEQKIGLMPLWVSEEGASDFAGQPLARESEITIRVLASGISPIPQEKRDAIYREVAEVKNIRVAGDGTLLLAARDDWDLRDGAQERAAKQGARFVDIASAEWEAASPTQLDAPPVDADGKITLQHFSSVGDLTVTDPTRWGEAGRFLPTSERQKIGTDPARTYFGIATGQPGGYVNEFGEGATKYEARIDASALYAAQADPEGLWSAGKERALIEAGYQGYWSNDPALGLVAVVFTPQEVARVDPDRLTLYQSDNPVFYSALAKAIEDSKQNKATAKQWRATLLKTPGVKEDEFFWTGLDEMLAMAPDATVTKEQLLGLVREGGVRVEEVLLEGASGISFEDFADAERTYIENDLREIAEERADEEFGDVPSFVVEREVIGQNPDLFEPGQTPIYGDGYQLVDQATGERRPEIYATQEEADDAHSDLDDELRKERAEARDAWVEEFVEDRIEEELRNRYDEIDPDEYGKSGDDGTKFREYSTARRDPDIEYRELLLTLPDFERDAPGTHWDQPGVVAHLRMRDAVDANGQRVLFIEEIQSDWHQKGRREGYKKVLSDADRARFEAEAETAGDAQTAAKNAWVAKFDEIIPQLIDVWRAARTDEDGIKLVAEFDELTRRRQSASNAIMATDRALQFGRGIAIRLGAIGLFEAETNALVETQQAYEAAISKLDERRGIMDAPFKTTWAQLVMKRAIRWAVDEGFDRVAWIRGEQQNGGATAVEPGVVTFYDEILPKTIGKLIKPFGAKVEGQVIPEFKRDADTGDWVSALTPEEAAQRQEALETINDAESMYGQALNYASEPEEDFRRAIERERSAAQRTVEVGNPNSPVMPAYVRLALNLSDADIVVAAGKEYLEARATLTRLRAGAVDRVRDKPTNLGFEITPAMREQATKGFPLFQRTGAPRGQVELSSTGSVITLFEDADLSTLLHETGHVFFEEFRRNATRADAPADVKRDWKLMKDWLAAQGEPVKRGQITRNAHELIARGFETYLMEGKAPSAELEGAFKTFRAWLIRIYKQLVALASPITPEVRGVFDRLLATDEAIAEYAAQQNTKSMFAEKPDDMSEAEFEAFALAVTRAREQANAELTEKVMAPIRQRETARQRDRNRKARERTTREINDEPRFIALHLLRTGRWLNDPEREAQPVKLNTGQVIDTYGEAALERLPKGPRLTSGDGTDIDLVAELTGFASGDAMMKALFNIGAEHDAMRAAGDKRQLRQRLIDEAVAAETGGNVADPLTDGSIEEEALAAVENATQGEVLGMELRYLARKTKSQHTPYRLAREWASRKVRGGLVQDVASRSAIQRYARAAAKAGRAAEAAILANDMTEAFRQKQAQLINSALVAEAKLAADEIEVIVRRMNRLASRSAMKTIDQGYFERVQELLEDYDFKPRSQRVINEKQDFNEWAAGQIAAGYEVLVPPRLRFAQNYLRVPVDELFGLNDAVQSLMKLGKLKQTLIDAGQQREFASYIDEIVNKVAESPDRKLEPTANTEDRLGAQIGAIMLKMETIADDLDGGDPNGPMNRLLVQRATQAENRRAKLREDVLFKIADGYLQMPAKMRKRLEQKVTIEEFPHRGGELDPRNGMPTTMTRMELLSYAMNVGNASNLEKMAAGEKVPEDRIMRVLQRELTKEDWDYVQSLWDAVDTLWPDIVKTESAMSGVAPEKVEPMPVDTPFGVYRGGYWPVVYDLDRSQTAEDNAKNDANDMFGFASGVNTPKGHTITRTGAVGPIRRSVEEVLFRHIEKVITRIAYAEYARDVMRVVKNNRVRNAIDVKIGPEYRREIETWLRRTINSGVDPVGSRWWEKFLRSMRVNVTLVSMGLRASTGVAQTLGLFSSAGRIGPTYVARGIATTMRNPLAAGRFVDARSEEMQRRGTELNRDVAEVFRAMRGKDGVLNSARGMAFWHIALMDRYVVSVPTWIGAHQKGIDEGMTDVQASAYADKIVRTTQGSGREKDLAAIQSPVIQSQAVLSMTMFYSFFNVQLNSQWEAKRAIQRGDWRKMAMLTFWFMVAAPLGDALLSGDIPDQDDDEDTWANWFARNVFFNLFSGVPVARDIAAYGERSITGEYASLSSTPLIRIEEAGKRGVNTAVNAWDGEPGERWLQTAIETPGYFIGLPTGQPGATAEFIWDYSNGDVDPEGFYDWYYGLSKGRLPDED